ncbi:MAG: RnfABCDGE type electron transport complex subunit C [Clostridiales bacterium]|nr:RnfABCDGE type electron transport complex subunit C [Clostridiales bacterium]
MKKLTFKTGFMPKDGLDFVHQRKFMREALLEVCSPREVTIPMKQHAGTACEPVVSVGDEVAMGDLIGKPTDMMGVPVHASISGTVTRIDTIRLPNKVSCKAVWIKNDLRRRVSSKIQTRKDYTKLSLDDLSKLLWASGICGMGGEGVPTYNKCMRARKAGVDTLLVNCTQSEPFLSCDLHHIRVNASKVLEGAMALSGICYVKRVIFCIEDTWADEIDALTKAVEKDRSRYMDRRIEVQVFKSRFPQGCQQLLIKALYDVELPLGKEPEEEVKTVLFNASTCYAFSEMIEKNQPLTSRIVTISGDTITGHNVLVPIGTSVSEILERVPGAHTAQRIAWGGAMTGVAIERLDVPIIKTTTAITIIRKFEPPRTNCIHCGACIGACPVGLSPYLLNRLIELGQTEAMQSESVELCIACGACSYVCPAGIELSTNIAKAAHRVRRSAAR